MAPGCDPSHIVEQPLLAQFLIVLLLTVAQLQGPGSWTRDLCEYLVSMGTLLCVVFLSFCLPNHLTIRPADLLIL